MYDGGFDATTPAIKWFWEIVLEWPMEQQAKLLLFATGCAKAPIGGLGKLNFKIQVRLPRRLCALPCRSCAHHEKLTRRTRHRSFLTAQRRRHQPSPDGSHLLQHAAAA